MLGGGSGTLLQFGLETGCRLGCPHGSKTKTKDWSGLISSCKLHPRPCAVSGREVAQADGQMDRQTTVILASQVCGCSSGLASPPF